MENDSKQKEMGEILEVARRVMETGKGERLTLEEEKILEENSVVVYTAYKKALEYIDKKEIGGIKDEPEL
ncbi:MAG: hypothetical protein J6A04_00450 [Clostridia bacterium]|nr:hypothetical protein [Clostridia bacterium]